MYPETSLLPFAAFGATSQVLEQRALSRKGGDLMVWKTPKVKEVCVGMEINDYFPAEF